jgi:hypothetical protein
MPLSAADQLAIVQKHNWYRKRVEVPQPPFKPWKPLPELRWAPDLAKGAENWAINLAVNVHDLLHSNVNEGPNPLGESIARSDNPYPLAQFVDMWAGEKTNFLLEGCMEVFGNACSSIPFHVNPDGQPDGGWLSIGHYTAIVWRDTHEVGCGLAHDATDGRYYFVARYRPGGNKLGATPGPDHVCALY